MALAKDWLSAGGTVMPVTPLSETVGTPDGRSVLMTGVPHAIASSCTMPKASLRATEGRTNRSAA